LVPYRAGCALIKRFPAALIEGEDSVTTPGVDAKKSPAVPGFF